MNRLDELKAKRSEIYAIAKRHKVKRLYVFGSCARREDTPESDVDFLAEFMPKTSLYDLIRLQDDLESFLGISVDIVSKDGIHPLLKDTILHDARRL